VGQPGLGREFAYEFHNRVSQRYGMHSVAQIIDFAIQLRKDGIFTEEDFKGCPSDVRGTRFWLADRIAYREGIGDVLANGISQAARQIGKGAEKYDDFSIKGIEQTGARVKWLNPTYFLMFATGDKARILQHEIWFPQRTAEFKDREEREAYIKEGWWDLPENLKEWFLDWESRKMRDYSPRGIAEAVELADYSMVIHNVTDSVGICSFWTGFETNPIWTMSRMAELISYVTGMDVDEPELVRRASRIDTLVRAYNVRRGLKRSDDRVPEGHYREPPNCAEIEAKLLDEYYKFKGWNIEGIPTKERLEELGLNYVGKDLEQRGFYKK